MTAWPDAWVAGLDSIRYERMLMSDERAVGQKVGQVVERAIGRAPENMGLTTDEFFD